jgi:filamentous hemagglutinin family protein
MKNKSNFNLSLRKVLLSALVAAPLAVLPAPLWALPSTASTNVTSSSSGTTFTTVGSTLNINTPDRSVLKWVNFGSGTDTIGLGDTLIYNLPGATASVLNMVTGSANTTIAGNITSNGRVLILNPNGIVLSSTATITTTGLSLSTIPESEFFYVATGELSYVGTAGVAGTIAINSPSISVGSSGNIFVAGKSADISGVINAGNLNVTTQGGAVNLAVTGPLDLGTAGNPGNGNLSITTAGGAVDLAKNGNTWVRGGTATLNTGGGAITQSAAGASVTSLAISDLLKGGAGYAAAPTVAISAPNLAGGVQATATATISTSGTNNGQVTGFTITNVGSGYTAAPTVTLTGAATTAATANAGAINAFTVGDGSNNANLSITAGAGTVTITNAAAAGGKDLVTTINSAGATSITATGAIQLNTSTVNGNLTIVDRNNTAVLPSLTYAGTGYTVAPTITVSAPNVTGGMQATAVAVIDTGSTSQPTRLAISLVNAGSGYTTAPTFTVATAGTTGGTPAAYGAADFSTLPAVLGSVAGAGDIKSGGSVTLDVATRVISLTSPGRKITYSGVGDLKIGTLVGNEDVITSTTGLIDLPGLTASKVTATAVTGIKQSGALIVTDTGTFNTTSGTITLTTATNDFNKVVLQGAPDGASVTDVSGVTLASGTNAAGDVTVVARGSGVQIGAASGDTVTIAGKLTASTTDGGVSTVANAVTFTNPGVGYKYAPVVTLGAPNVLGGVQATATATVDLVATSLTFGQVTKVSITNPGSGYTVTPTVSFAGGAPATAAVANNAPVIASAITDGTDNATVLGSLNLSATGSVTLNGSSTNAINLKNRWGQVNVSTASDVTVYEQTTLNLGTITTAGPLLAYGVTGVINTGKLNITGLTTVGAGTAIAPGDISLNFVGPTVGTGNVFTGGVTVLDDLELLSQGAVTIGNYLARNVTIVSDGTLTGVTIPVNVYGEGLKGDLSLTSTNGAITSGTGKPIVLTGKLTLASPSGAITVNDAANSFGSVAVTAGGSVDVLSSVALKVDATLAGTAGNANTAKFASGGNLTLGTITSNFGGLTTFDTTAGDSISDSVAGLQIFGAVKFNAKNNVTINKAGHSFGGVELDTGSDGKTLTIVENGTLKITKVAAAKGTVNLTSTTGDIIQTGAITATDSSKTVTVSAPLGKVDLSTSTNAVDAAWAVTALGDVAIKNTASNSGNATVLAGISTSGKLTVTNGSSRDIVQKSGTKINAYDTVTVTSGGGNIALTNTGNRFGGLVLTGGAGNISVTEDTTLNVKSAQTSAKLTLVSESGDIIDSVDSTVALNKISNGAGAIGAATFTANKGSVTLDLPGNVFSTVSINTLGNAAIIQTLGDITLDTSVIGGTFDVTNTAANANILQAGPLSVTGNASFITSSGGLSLSNTSNQLGATRFVVGATGATVNEATTFNLRAGTVATGPVVISTSGGFLTSGTGGSSFTNNLTVNALGTIIPGAGSILVTGTFTVFSNNTKDLSALSKSGNLAGKDPVNLGTGTYIPPGP